MQRHGTIWNGILPLVLGALLILGCGAGSAGGVYAAEGAGPGSVQSPDATPPGGAVRTGSDLPRGSAMPSEQKKAPKGKGHAATAKPAQGRSAAQPLPEGIGSPAAARKQYTGKPVSLDLLDADLRNVLRLLADVTGTNIVIEPDVTGKVTLKVEQVPWDQVLDMVLSMNDLGKEQLGNVIRVAKQAKLRQEYQQQVEAIRAKQELSETTKDLGELSTVYLPVNFGKPAEIAAKLSEAKSERGKVAVDERTSLLIYTDYPARIANARQLLLRLDRPTPQVLIEARIITLKSTVTRTLGVDFTLTGSHQTSPVPPVQDFHINPPNAANPYQLGMTVAQLFGKTLINVDLQIAALETANDARVVAAPRVLTLDNVKAVVTQGVQVPYLKVGDTAANVTGTEFKDATLELQVTPHITPDRKVRMTVDAKQDTVSTTSYGGQPGIDTRKVSTELLVDDGNVIVIGGVIDNSSTHNVSSTPGLSKIPLLGRLFKNEDSKDSRNELLIFISPKIVEVSKPLDRT